MENVNLEELAKKIGVAASYLNDMEKNKRAAPRLDIIKKLSKTRFWCSCFFV